MAERDSTKTTPEKPDTEFLDLLLSIQQNKDVDQIGEFLLSVISVYGLTVDEVCAMAYYLVDTTLKAEHNKQFMQKCFNIDVNDLGIDGVLTTMKAMIATYVDKVRQNG